MGHKLWRGLRVGNIITGINHLSNEIPEKFQLYQNYPNPFNPITNIRFGLPKASDVKLIVYDISGRKFAVPVNETLNAGEYSADWDASNYPSGIYLYKLTGGNYTESKKMIWSCK